MRVHYCALLLGVCLCVSFASSQPSTKNSKTAPIMRGGKTLSQWKDELKHPDASRRADAVIAIASFGDANAECVTALIGVTHDPDVSPKVRAVIAMRMVSIDDKDIGKVIHALAARLDKANEFEGIVRLEAVVSLGRFVRDPSINTAVPGLIKGTLDKKSWEIRHHCVSTLWRVGREQKTGTDEAIYEALLAVLTFEKTYQVRVEALQGLGSLGRPTNPALLSKVVDRLEVYSRSENKPLAIGAYSSLVAMQEGKTAEGSLVAISKFLESKRLETRIQAANALGALGARAKSRVPMLVVMLKDPETSAVWAACNALGSIGVVTDKVVDALMELVAHKDPSRAAAAVTTLVNLKVNTTRVTGTLDKMLEDKKLDNRLSGVIKSALVEFANAKK